MRALKQAHLLLLPVALHVTTQAHEGIETRSTVAIFVQFVVTTQAHEGIETFVYKLY